MLKRSVAIVWTAVLVVSCGSGQGTTPVIEAPSTSTVETTSTTLPPPESRLEIHIDPAVEASPVLDLAVDAVIQTAKQYPVRPGTIGLFYGSGEESIAWAEQKAKELDCFQDLGPNGFSNSVGWGRPCGFLMRIDGVPFECALPILCKQGRTVAAHEFFHVVAYQVLEECLCEPKIFGNKIPNWLNEGIADYVGYAMIYGATPGSLGQEEMNRLRSELKDRASNPDIAVGVIALEDLWAGGFQEPWFQYLYDRSFLAVTLLVERFGEEAVLKDFLANVTQANTFSVGFETTFGITEAEFDSEFQSWISTL